MKTPTLYSVVILTHFILCSTCRGIDGEKATNDAMLTPSEILDKSRLKKEIQLANGAEVYMEVVKLFDENGTVAPGQEGMTSRDVNMAWKSNPEADKQSFTLVCSKGMSVMDVIQELTKRRLEKLAITKNNIVITPVVKDGSSVHYQKKGGTASNLEILLDQFISASLLIREPEGIDIETLINARFQYAWRGSHDEGTSPFNIKVVGNAQKRTNTFNLIGYWTYKELFNSIEQTTGLKWHVEGNTVILGE
jgi:hypothetical protein